MTINLANNNPRIEYSVAQAATQSVFAIPFEFFDDTDIDAYVDSVLKTEGTHYTLSGGDGSTGTLTFSPAITGATGGSTVVIVRNIAVERTSDFSAGSDINRAALNEQLDILTAMIADLKNKVDRSPTLYDYDVVSYQMMIPPTAQRSSKYLAFGATGDLTVVSGTTSNIVVSTFAETLIDDANAAAALQTLGLTATAAELNVLDGATASTAEINILDGLTASTAELNILDGATLTTVELNYVDGVTSAIQTQLDTKYSDSDLASQAEAQAGTNNTKLMTPLRSAEAIAALSNGMVLLATLNTTSGQTVTASGLDLTNYKMLSIEIDGIGDNSATSGMFSVAGIALVGTGTNATFRIYGSYSLLLSSGILTGFHSVAAPTAPPQLLTQASGGGRTAITNASTSISVTIATTNFAAGVVRIYGLR